MKRQLMNNAHPAQIFRHWSSVNFVQSFEFRYFFIHKTHGHVYAGHEWQQRKTRLFLTEKKKTSPKSHRLSVVPALLSRLWWLSSSTLIITYNQGLKQDVLQRVVGISVCSPQAPGTLWSLGNLGNSSGLRAPWEPLAVPLAGSHLLWWITVFGGLWGSALGHTQFWWLFFIFFSFPLMCSELENWKGLKISLWQVMPQDIFHN